MKRVALTGASGFIGANLTRRLIAEGCEVHLLLRQNYNPWRIESIQKNVKIHIVNLQDPRSTRKVIEAIQPDWVFHLAAYGAYSSQTEYQQMIDTNLTSTINLVNACMEVGFEAFINTGSSSEYGYKDHPPKEDEWIEPNSIYAITKAAATHYCRFIAQSKKVSLATVRLYSVFGPYEEPTRLIPSLIIEGLQGKLPPLVNPTIARDFVFVNDVSNAYISLASNSSKISSEVFNLGTGTQVSIQEVVEIARQLLPIQENPLWGSMPDRQWDTSCWVCDHSRITKAVNWQLSSSFAEGFQETINWFKTHPEMIEYYRLYREAIS